MQTYTVRSGDVGLFTLCSWRTNFKGTQPPFLLDAKFYHECSLYASRLTYLDVLHLQRISLFYRRLDNNDIVTLGAGVVDNLGALQDL